MKKSRQGRIPLIGIILVVCLVVAAILVAGRLWRTDEPARKPPVPPSNTKPTAGVEPPEESKRPSTSAAPPVSNAAEDALKKEQLEVTRQLMKAFPNSVGPIGLMGNVQRVQGNSAEAVRCWKKCIKLEPNRVDGYYNIGLIALKKGQFEKARAMFHQAIQVDPARFGTHFHLAKALMGLGEMDDAVAALEQEVRISSQSGPAYRLLGQAYAQLGDHQNAKKSYLRAVDVAPDHDAYYGLATACTRLGERDEAKQYMAEFRKLKVQQRENVKDLRDKFDALELMRQSVSETYTNAAYVYRGHGYVWKAEKHWKRAAALAVTNGVCRLELASLYEKSNRLPEALQVCKQIQKLEPDNVFSYVRIGVLCARLRQFEPAEQAYQQAIEVAPKRPEGYRALALLYLDANQKLPQTKTLAEEAVKQQPSGPNYALLARACARNGDRAGALSAIDRAVELKPQNAQYRQMQTRLQETE